MCRSLKCLEDRLWSIQQTLSKRCSGTHYYHIQHHSNVNAYSLQGAWCRFAPSSKTRQKSIQQQWLHRSSACREPHTHHGNTHSTSVIIDGKKTSWERWSCMFRQTGLLHCFCLQHVDEKKRLFSLLHRLFSGGVWSDSDQISIRTLETHVNIRSKSSHRAVAQHFRF